MGASTKQVKESSRRLGAYSTGEVAILLGISATQAASLMDRGLIASFKVPMSKYRRATHQALVDFVAREPRWTIARKRLEEAAKL